MGRINWRPESHPTRHKHFEERGLTQWNNPKLGCSAVGPSVQHNDQVRRARDDAHVLIKGFSESLPRYALIQLRFERSKEYFYTLSMRFNVL